MPTRRQRSPGSINPEWTTLLRGNPDVDHVHIFPRGEFRGLSAPRSLLPWLKKTKTLRPDVAFDFQGLLRSALIGRVSRPREFWGMSDGREGSRLFYHRVAKVDRRAHAVDRYLKLAEAFGATVPEQLRFPLPTGDALPRFDAYPPFILLHPFARGARKSLSNSVIEEFCRAFDPIRVVIVGKTARQITVPENCVNLANQTTLLQLIWLIRAARFTISVDSGPMHIAAAVTRNCFPFIPGRIRAASGRIIPRPGSGKMANASGAQISERRCVEKRARLRRRRRRARGRTGSRIVGSRRLRRPAA